MKIPPIEIPLCKAVEVAIRLETPCSDDPAGFTEVRLVDEGGGYFAEISAEVPGHPIRIDPDQLYALANWVEGTCKALDAENARQTKPQEQGTAP
jgi:hypothetical protein